MTMYEIFLNTHNFKTKNLKFNILKIVYNSIYDIRVLSDKIDRFLCKINSKINMKLQDYYMKVNNIEY